MTPQIRLSVIVKMVVVTTCSRVAFAGATVS